MAAFKQHLMFSCALGAGYTVALRYADLEPTHALLAGGLCGVSGMLPDLDSDSGRPVRELFGVAAAFVPFLLLHRLRHMDLTQDQVLVILIGVYLLIRYGLAEFFKRLSVHRGMFHSIPALLISGLCVFLLYDHDDIGVRYYLAAGVMIGFFSHLALDEIYAVDLGGIVPRLNNFAGSALKLFSASWTANVFTYTLLFMLAAAAWRTVDPNAGSALQIQVAPSQGRQTFPWLPGRS